MGVDVDDPPYVSMMCVNVPGKSSSSANPARKSKGRTIEPHARIYVGDRDELQKTFISIDEVEVEEIGLSAPRSRLLLVVVDWGSGSSPTEASSYKISLHCSN